MTLPFTTEQFLDIFRQYNTAVWPLQVVLAAIGLATGVLAAIRPGARLVSVALAGLWAWTAIVYHWVFFTRINGAAWLFGGVWLAGAAAFAWDAGSPRPRSPARLPGSAVVGWALIAYALAVYPLIGHVDGRAYPFAPTFGAPCPVTLATFGVLWLSPPTGRRSLLLAPLLWAAIGSSAALTLGVREDAALLVAAASGVVLLLRRPTSTPASPAVERVV